MLSKSMNGLRRMRRLTAMKLIHLTKSWYDPFGLMPGFAGDPKRVERGRRSAPGVHGCSSFVQRVLGPTNFA